LIGLQTGYYSVQFLTNGGNCPVGGNYLEQYYDTTDANPEGMPVGVTQGDTTAGINATMTAGGEITGSVTNESDDPVTGVEVGVYAEQGPDSSEFPEATACTAANGSYVLPALQAGSYQVGFISFNPTGQCGGTANLAPQYYNGTTAGAEYLSGAASLTLSDGTVEQNVNATLAAPGGQITGTVTNGSDQPLADVEVDVSGGPGVDGWWGTSGDSVCTSSDGSYAVSGLPSGTYTVDFTTSPFFDNANCDTASDYLTQFFDGEPGGASDYADASPVSVTVGSATTGIDATLSPSGGISGTVTDQSNENIENVDVVAFDSSGNQDASDCTAADGTYELTGLTPGAYTVEFSGDCGVADNYVTQYYDGSPGGASASSGGAAVSVSGGATTEGIDAVLAPGGQISGTVTNASSEPIANVEVDVYDSAGDEVSSSCTAADGTYTIPALGTGSYDVDFDASGFEEFGDFGVFPDECAPVDSYISQYFSDASAPATATAVGVTAGDTHAGVDATLVAAGQISGTVTDQSDVGLANVEVDVYASGLPVAQACTGSDGTYTVNGLAAGDYSVGFQPAIGFCYGAGDNYLGQFYDAQTELVDATSVPVTSGEDTPNVNATIATGGEITGTVKNASSQPVGGIAVDLYDSGGDDISETCTAADGTYTFGALTTDTYTVGFDPSTVGFGPSPCSGANYLPQFDGDAATDAAATPIGVTEGATPSVVNATLAAAGAISGQVVNADGEEVATVGIQILNASNDAIVTAGCTSGNGSYDITGLPTGHYIVGFDIGDCVSSNTSAYLPQYYDGASTPASGTPVPVTDGSTTTGIDATLAPAGAIAGTVTDADTGLAAEVDVDITTVVGHHTYGGCTTSAGTYDIGGLPSGMYTVEFAPGGPGCGSLINFVSQYFDGQTSAGAANPVTVTAGSTTKYVDGALTESSLASGVPVSSSQPAIGGVALVGDTLTESHATWSNGPNTYTYQWEDCGPAGATPCRAIAAATQPSYVVAGADIGHTIIVVESAHNAIGAGTPDRSAATATVALPPVPVGSGAPGISGSAVLGSMLTESHATWSNAPTRYAYQWQDCNSGGSACSSISGATRQTYTVATSDVGHTIVVTETASNAGGSGNPVASTPTAVVVGPSPSPSQAAVTAAVADAGVADAGIASVTGDAVSTLVACTGTSACDVTASLTISETLKGAKVIAAAARAKQKTSKRTVTVGSQTTTIAAGQSAMLTVKLSATAVSLLSRFHTLPATLTTTQSASGTVSVVATQGVTFKSPRHRKKR
jgi:hypothetical protein